MPELEIYSLMSSEPEFCDLMDQTNHLFSPVCEKESVHHVAPKEKK